MLDGGRGAGEESIVLARFGARKFIGIYLSGAPLKRANEKKKYLNIIIDVVFTLLIQCIEFSKHRIQTIVC